jgi:hypothetical protein
MAGVKIKMANYVLETLISYIFYLVLDKIATKNKTSQLFQRILVHRFDILWVVLNIYSYPKRKSI